MKQREINGTYGEGQTFCTIFVHNDWYCIEGSVTVFATSDPKLIVDDVDTENLENYDYFTWSSPIESVEELINAVKFKD